MIPLGDLYCVIVAVYLLQLYQSCSRLLGHIDYSSPLRHLFEYLLGHPLRRFLGYPLKYPLRHLLGYLLRYPIQA